MRQLLIYLFLLSTNINSLENLIISLEIRSGKDISNYLTSESEIVLNEKTYTGNNYQFTKILDKFFEENEINTFKVIHKGNSENNLIYILGEYYSNDDIYKVLITLIESEKKTIIQKLNINKKS